jgi:Universal stress protein UspA and related nucleotide-binding proteins
MTIPIRMILVPLDGSALAEQALPLAVELARASGAILHLTHVFVPYAERSDMPGVAEKNAEFERQMEEEALVYLQGIAERLGGELPGQVQQDPVRAHPILSPYSESVAVVERLRHMTLRLRPDLVVMSTHARGGIGRAWLGSVADALIRRVSVPVLLVHPRDTATPPTKLFSHILLPLDGSALAEQSIPLASALATLCSARLTLLRVIVPQPSIMPLRAPAMRASAEILKSREVEANDYLARVRESLGTAVQCIDTATVMADHPARAILEWVAEHEVDLVAMSTHGRSGMKRFILGSIADKVLRSSPVPVLLTRPAATDATPSTG